MFSERSGNQLNQRLNKQHGIAVLALLSLALITITSFMIAAVSLNKQSIDRNNESAAFLKSIKDQLMGYALRQATPGLLPCPDTNGDGESNVVGGSCTAQLGFLPFRTLLMEDGLDNTGAPIWYAVELTYTEVVGGVELNSSLASTVQVDGLPAAAVILAPGEAIETQIRNNNNVINYLEGINADANTADYTKLSSATLNDQVIALETSYYWQTIEQLVLSELQARFDEYFNTSNCSELPWPSIATSAPYDSAANENAGKIPFGTAANHGVATGCPNSLSASTWLETHWVSEIHYVLCAQLGNNCLTTIGDNTLTPSAIIIAPGVSLAGQTRPSAALTDYFENDNNNSDTQFEFNDLRNHNNAFNDQINVISP